MGIKEEAQGPNGYLKQVREEYMPDTKNMANLAYEQCTKLGFDFSPENVEKNADEMLKGLFLAETDIFYEKNQEILNKAIPYYYNYIFEKKDKNYTETSMRVNALVDIYNQCKDGNYSFEDFIEGVSKNTTPIIDILSFSQKQSAKCRVGETFQNSLSTIFNICKVDYETQQQKGDGGTIMDFVIPRLSAIEEMPDQVINIECQTTLKDRFRLTTGKSTDAKVRRYLATLTGAGIVTKRDVNDFSVEKVKEIIMDNNVTLVVLPEVKVKIIDLLKKACEKGQVNPKKGKAVFSSEDIEKLYRLSDKKIITFSELLHRDIKSVKTYWEDSMC